RQWDAASGAAQGQWLTRCGQATSFTPSPDGKVVWVGSYEKSGFWDLASGQWLGLPVRQAYLLSFSGDGRRALFQSQDRARLWDVTLGKPLGPPASMGPERSAALSPDGRSVLTAQPDQSGFRLWSVTPLAGEPER